MFCEPSHQPEEYDAAILHPASIIPRNDGERPLDYYPKSNRGYSNRNNLICQVITGEYSLMEKIIRRYIEQGGAAFPTETPGLDFCYLYSFDEKENLFWVVGDNWAYGMISHWQKRDFLPKYYQDGSEISEAKSINQLIAILQRISQEYPHWIMEIAYMVLPPGDLASRFTPKRRYDLLPWETVSAQKYFQRLLDEKVSFSSLPSEALSVIAKYL